MDEQLDWRKRMAVVLVRPRNPLNIGAAARAMANFGYSDLRVVAPYEPHWQEAQSGVGADALLKNAKRTESLAEAVADCTLVAGTTLTYRKPEQPVVGLPALGALVLRELGCEGRIALVFGPEKHGLTREDLSYCHLLVEIPTDAAQPSMNLGHAVAVCLYELAWRGLEADARAGLEGKAETEPAEHEVADGVRATAGELERLAGMIEETMAVAGYRPTAMREANRHDLRLLLRRLRPGARDTRRMLGLFRRILWRLRAETTRQRGGGKTR